ncbi:MAG: hypothetical protein HYR96_07920 [Deltaproteobacteria bacterium]|nr:hypothetical protein [Deltaproteobacteria bacterium]
MNRSAPPKILTASAIRPSEDRPVKGRNILPAWNGLISRLELENRIGRPRSTTNRLITRWIDEGKIRKEGNSKSTRYAYIARQDAMGAMR